MPTAASYQVEHHTQDIEGSTYSLQDSFTLWGLTGEAVQVRAAAYPGFTPNPALGRPAGVITEGSGLVLSLYYTRNTCSVTFDSAGGSAVPSQSSVLYETAAEEPVPPTKPGFLFAGWYSDSELSKRWDFSEYTVTGDLTLRAKWTPTGYSITYKLDGGTNSIGNPSYYRSGDLPLGFSDPKRTGYTFGGWYADAGFTEPLDILPADFSGNAVLHARWIPETYTLTLDRRQGSPPGPGDTRTVTYEALYGDLGRPLPYSYAFDGWWTKPEGKGVKITADTPVSITKDHTLYASWIAYQIGDTGPAGGTVFYDKGAVTDGWRYIETAPESTVWSAKPWGGMNENSIGVLASAVGTGSDNTDNIIETLGDEEPYQDRSDYAAKLCSDLVVTYDGIVYDNWHLPSIEELLTMYQALGNDFVIYLSMLWSSTEYSSNFPERNLVRVFDKSQQSRTATVYKDSTGLKTLAVRYF